MFKVEVCKREKISIEDDASEVAYDLFCIICLLQWNFRPQCCYEEVDVSYVYNSIVIAVNIGTYFKEIAVGQCRHIIIFVELMVAHAGYDLLIVLRSPVPEGMLGIVLVSQVADVSSQN